MPMNEKKYNCPVEAALSQLGGKYKAIIPSIARAIALYTRVSWGENTKPSSCTT